MMMNAYTIHIKIINVRGTEKTAQIQGAGDANASPPPCICAVFSFRYRGRWLRRRTWLILGEIALFHSCLYGYYYDMYGT